MCVVLFSGSLFLGVVEAGVRGFCRWGSWSCAGLVRAGLLVSLFVFCVVGEVCCGVY